MPGLLSGKGLGTRTDGPWGKKTQLEKESRGQREEGLSSGPGLPGLKEKGTGGLDSWIRGRRGWGPGLLGLKEGPGVWTPRSEGEGAGGLDSWI